MNEINVKVKRLHKAAVIPKYATTGSAGFDLVATEDVIIEPGETKLVPTGLAFEIPVGYEMQIRPRSGISLKTKLRVANAPGTIDSDYRGEVCVIITNIAEDSCGNVMQYLTHIDGLDYRTEHELYPNETYLIRKGDRIAQGVMQRVPIAKFIEVDEIDETTRCAGGFGSTGVETKEGK